MGEVREIHEIIEEISPYYKRQGKSDALHTLVYESYSETLEPVYFFIMDLMNDLGLKVEKLVDNFSPSPGSGHFSELGQKATIMQQQGSKIMGDINMVLKSVLNVIYDLKEFKIRLQSYEDLKSKEKNKSESAELALKQIWMDKVDINKGNSSIKAMALGQAGFQTLIDAFLVVKNEKDVSNLDLNDRVKRIIYPRIQEFNTWVKHSELELTKRYNLQRNYLKSQVNSLKLYSRWVRPYLKAAQQLEAKDPGRNPALVKTFNRVILELTLLGKSKLDPKESATAGNLPKDFQKLAIKRNYNQCVLINFMFRAVPQQGNFLGRAEITFRAYSLNDDELKKLDQELEESDLGDVLKLIEGATIESLGELQKEINYFLEDKSAEEKSEEKIKEGDVNPISALFSPLFKKDNKKKEEKSKKGKEEKSIDKVRPDDWIEKEHLRKLSVEKAKEVAYNIFDIYKKSHGMASFT